MSQAAPAALVLVAALAAGVVGGMVGVRLANDGQALGTRNAVAAEVAHAAPQAASIDWDAYGKRWQSQYLAMYPPKLDPIMVKYGIDWQRQYDEQHPQH
jgi:glucose dehydrogenase